MFIGAGWFADDLSHMVLISLNRAEAVVILTKL